MCRESMKDEAAIIHTLIYRLRVQIFTTWYNALDAQDSHIWQQSEGPTSLDAPAGSVIAPRASQ